MKRVYLVYGLLVITFAFLILRTYNIMIVNGKKYARAAAEQSGIRIDTDSGRGNIYDRNLLSFTSVKKKKMAVVVKSDNSELDFKICSLLSKADSYRLYSELYSKKIVFYELPWDFNANLLSEYVNVYVYDDTQRYESSGLASAVIGYTSDGEGLSGIEYAANKYLKNGDNGVFYLTKDANGKLLSGLSFEKEKNQTGLLLRTTLDRKYTEICQNALKEKSGAAVLLEIPSFNLMAMVSSPTFDGNCVENYLQSPEKPLLNRATSLYDMGSVFKIVVAAAALESNSVDVDEKFECNGLKKVGDVPFLCKNHEQLAYMTLKDAFVHSCNSVFIDIGQKTSYNNIIDMACTFGLNQKLIYPETFPQNTGLLPDKNNYYLADIANLSIGQGKLMGTVVHGAYISGIIANGGVANKINILDSLLDMAGNPRVDLKEYCAKRVISEQTAEVIADMMQTTVETGTGKSAVSPYVQSSGKTGSAQTGIVNDGESVVHAWFTGFFPVESPKYALCVFIEDGKSGGASAAPVFREISEKIALMEGW